MIRHNPNLTEKRCTGCKLIKPLEEFYIDKRNFDKRCSCCKKCLLEADHCRYKANPQKKREVAHLWSKNNSEKRRIICRRYAKANPEKVRKATLRSIKANPEKNKFWRKNNPEKCKKITYRSNKKRRSTPQGKINQRMATGIRDSLNGNKGGRAWETLVGYTVEQVKRHIEKRFTDGMTWEQFLKGKIHIDHKIPLSVFNFEKSEDIDFQKAWSLNNLQPLWATDNLKKRNKLDKPFQPSLILRNGK